MNDLLLPMFLAGISCLAAGAQEAVRPSIAGRAWVVFTYRVIGNGERELADFDSEEEAIRYERQLTERTDFWSGTLYGRKQRIAPQNGTVPGPNREERGWDPSAQAFLDNVAETTRNVLEKSIQDVQNAAERANEARQLLIGEVPALAEAKFLEVNRLIAAYQAEVNRVNRGPGGELFRLAPKIQLLPDFIGNAAVEWRSANERREALLPNGRLIELEAAKLQKDRDLLVQARLAVESAGKPMNESEKQQRSVEVASYRQRLADFEARKSEMERQIVEAEAAVRAAFVRLRLPPLQLGNPPRSSEDAFIAGRGGQTGEVQVSLFWNNVNDLDLHVTCPSGERVSFGNKSSSCGGSLDVDMNAGGSHSNRAVENVVWAVAPRGRYVVQVNNYANHGAADPTEFVLRVRVAGREQRFQGRALAGQTVTVAEFTR